MKPTHLRRALLVFALWLVAIPVQALDKTNFPMKVYINPNAIDKSGKSLSPVRPSSFMALRQGVLDWNRMLLQLPKQAKKDELYVIVLRAQNDEQYFKEQNEILSKLGILVFTDKREQADLVIEAIDAANLGGEDNPFGEDYPIGIFKSGRGYPIGKIEMSLNKFEFYGSNRVLTPNNDFDLRTVLIHELGHAFGLGHINDDQCNFMAPNKKTCETDSPYECRPSALTTCIGARDYQIRRVEQQLAAEAGKGLSAEYEDVSDYSRLVDEKIEENLDKLGTFKQRGQIKLKLSLQGEVNSIEIEKSFGSPELDARFQALVKEIAPFGPLPVGYKKSEFVSRFFYDPNPALDYYLDTLKESLNRILSEVKLKAEAGTIRLTINGDGELQGYKITKSFGDKDLNLKVSTLIEGAFPIKPLPGIAKSKKIATDFTYTPPVAKPVVITKLAPTPKPKNQPQKSTLPPGIANYMAEVRGFISSNWTPPVSDTQREVTVYFTLLRNGRIKDLKIQSSSGDPKVDEAALKAIQATAFNPIPKAEKYDFIRTRYTFRIAAPIFTEDTQQADTAYDINPYFTLLQQRIQDSWQPLADVTENTQVTTGFVVQRDGTISDIRIVKSSDNSKADDAALATLRRTKLDPLPTGYKSNTLPVTFTFSYRKQGQP